MMLPEALNQGLEKQGQYLEPQFNQIEPILAQNENLPDTINV